MLRSKSRSGSVDFGPKIQSSILSRTLSASKLCRGDALISQIDNNAQVERKPSKVPSLSENRIHRVLTMQEQMGQIANELERTKELLYAAEKERNKALDEVKETKRLALEANMRAKDALSPKKAEELYLEIRTLKELLSNSQEEAKRKDGVIELLKVELEKAKAFELKLSEAESSVSGLEEEVRKLKGSEVHGRDLLSEREKRIQELEAELDCKKLSESKLLESLTLQSKQFEKTKIELEESRLEIASLHVMVESFKASLKESNGPGREDSTVDNAQSTSKELESMRAELQLANKDLFHAQESVRMASLKEQNLRDEITVLKNELNLALEAEEKSRKAMDDLALALKEVATEANEAREKLSTTQLELEHVKGEAAELKEMVLNSEEKHNKALEEAKKEIELHKNTAARLRLEAEETLLAWNGKEMGFVGFIKRAEEETAVAQHENARLAESVKAAEQTARLAKEENYKLRDILKQAINEANAAKAAAGIARDENSQLKDCLAEKDEALDFLTRETERLRINEAAAHENVKEFKRLLSTASSESKSEEKEQGMRLRSSKSFAEEFQADNKDRRNFSFDLSELAILREPEQSNEASKDEDPEKAEALKGSIFDTTDSPHSEPHTPKSGFYHPRRTSSAFTDDGEIASSEDFDHADGSHYDSDGDRNSHRRRKALFRRVGDLILRKSFHKKEPSIE